MNRRMDRRVREVIERIRAQVSAPRSNESQTAEDGAMRVERMSLTLNEVAKLVRLSPTRLRVLFKAETGMTLAQYARSVRIEKAKELAGSTYLKVHEIVEEVGGGEQSHFLREFKKAEGGAISEYRELCYERSEAQAHEGH